MRHLGLLLVFVITIATISSCNYRNEVSISEDNDSCDYCRMLFVDKRFGSILIDKKGKIFKFDDISCLKSYMSKNDHENSFENLFFIDYNDKNQVLNYNDILIIKTNIHTPMSSGLIALNTKGPSSKALLKTTFKENHKWKWDQFISNHNDEGYSKHKECSADKHADHEGYSKHKECSADKHADHKDCADQRECSVHKHTE